MIANKPKFMTGLTLMVLFSAVFIAIFMPLFGGKNGLEYLDNLYNSISKGSAYYIDSVRKDVQTIKTPDLTMTLTMKSEVQAQQTVPLFMKAGAQVDQDGAQLTVTGNMIQILNHCLDDAQQCTIMTVPPYPKNMGMTERWRSTTGGVPSRRWILT